MFAGGGIEGEDSKEVDEEVDEEEERIGLTTKLSLIPKTPAVKDDSSSQCVTKPPPVRCQYPLARWRTSRAAGRQGAYSASAKRQTQTNTKRANADCPGCSQVMIRL